ncbi:MAG TPA: zf-HC2 domain-containing protein [Thermoanaerobaculia bacterium]|nr:zf-HC2 domain-containing protein [Thermoanaerobaculia bacterium]
MTHADIEERQIIDLYVMGKLPPEEAESFEDHYLDCPQCLDRLAAAESLERGFKRAARQDVARATVGRQLAALAWLGRLGRSRQMAVLLSCLLIAVGVPALLSFREIGARDRELAIARSALEREHEKTSAGNRAASDAEALRGQLAASRRDLDRERQKRTAVAEQLEQARRPQGNVPFLFLNAERGGASREPTFRLRMPKQGGWIVLALEIDPPYVASYGAILRDARGRELWRGADLRATEIEPLSLSFPATLLAPGDYTIEVSRPAAGRSTPAGRFTFRILPAA